MKSRDTADLLLLAALWGASFLFLRVAAPSFGPLALVFVRVAGASAVLVPLLLWQGQVADLRRHWRPIAVVGVLNSVLPFIGFSVAALVLQAGLSAIFNATTPLWTAVIAWLWLGRRPGRWPAVGLALGFIGVLGLAMERASLRPGEHGVSPAIAILACVAAASCYGLAANFTQRHLSGVPAIALAAGSQLTAALVTLLPAVWAWPTQPPPATAWGAALVLATVSTGLAYILYFRLIARVGPSSASTVTFLIPAFAVVWGAVFLGEQPTAAMAAGGLVILLGTALATGLLRGPATRRRPGQA